MADAERCYRVRRSRTACSRPLSTRAARGEALHWLAINHRRARRFAQAADTWQQLLDVPGLSAELRREALEALAIHAEHRAKDLAAARRFALNALDVSRGSRHAPEVEHRLGRLARKLGGPLAPPLLPGPIEAALPADD